MTKKLPTSKNVKKKNRQIHHLETEGKTVFKVHSERPTLCSAMVLLSGLGQKWQSGQSRGKWSTSDTWGKMLRQECKVVPVLNYLSHQADVCGRDISAYMLNLETRWGWSVSYMGILTSGKEPLTGGWAGPITGLDVAAKRKISAHQDSNPSHPAHSHG